MSLFLERSGPQTTVQDLGRAGCQRLGLGPGGAADPLSHRLANLLVGNPPSAATLEVALGGAVVRFEVEARAALCGADLGASLDGVPVPLWRPLRVRAGARLAFGGRVRGARAYLAVAGGIQSPVRLGGRGPIPGADPPRLPAGARLPMAPQEPGPAYAGPFQAPSWFLPWFQVLDLERPVTLRLIPGPAFDPRVAEAEWRVAPASDRRGLRLAGPVLAASLPECLSAPVATGTVQLPRDGQPILLLADRQTTGGYPRLGEVATVDLPAAAQLAPGEAVRFQPVDVEVARGLLREREAWLAAMEEHLAKGLAWEGGPG